MPYRKFIAALYVCLSLSTGSHAEAPQAAVPNQWDGVYVENLTCSKVNSQIDCFLSRINTKVTIKNNTFIDMEENIITWIDNTNFSGIVKYSRDYKEFNKIIINSNGKGKESHPMKKISDYITIGTHIEIENNFLYLTTYQNFSDSIYLVRLKGVPDLSRTTLYIRKND